LIALPLPDNILSERDKKIRERTFNTLKTGAVSAISRTENAIEKTRSGIKAGSFGPWPGG
jgi:hypothetical protein